MNLPFFKRFKKKVLPLYYLVLVLRDEKAEAVIFEEHEGIAKIVGEKEEHFSTSIDAVSQEELLEKLDIAISSAESSLPENVQTQKTIFGIKESWSDNDQIKKEYLTKLKKIKEELGLVPIGFLVISQAISHLLQKEEGAPVSAILVEINKKSITVTLLRAGKNIETKSSEIHETIPFTVDTLLKHFDVPEILPSRIVIFNGKEDFSQEFISHTWSKSLPFLHLPQITNLPEGFDAKAVLFGAATQMGFRIVDTKALEKPEKDEEEIKEINTIDDPIIPTVETETEAKEENPIEDPEIYKNLGAADFGFAKDVDVAKLQFQPAIDVPQSDSSAELIDNSPYGEKENIGSEETVQIDIEEKQTTRNSTKKIGNILATIKNGLANILGLILIIFKKINFKQAPSTGPLGKLKIAIPVILLLIVALVAGYFLFIKATITITVNPEVTQQDKSILFSTTKATDPANNIIKGEFVTISEDGSVSTATTGKKDIGTNAKGSIIIFSILPESKYFPAGTTITSSNGLEYAIDNSITIASASAESGKSTATVNVTASGLGQESNLPSGMKFSIGTFDTAVMLGKNDNPFSGGTKKTVTVVSKTDSSKLGADLTKQLENNAKEDLQKQIGPNKILLSSFITEDIGQNSLNAKVGDEANQVTLTGTVEYKGIAYDKSDMITFSKSLLSKNVPSNQEIDYNNIQTNVLDIKNKNDEEIQANLNIKTLLLPKIDKAKLTQDLKGKSFKIAENTLYKLSQIANVSIKLSPNLPFLPKTLPASAGNINILITK